MRRFVKTLIFIIIFILIVLLSIFMLTPQVYINKVNYIEVVDEEDNSLYSLINSSLSSYVPLEEISDEFKKTIVTIEDKRFYSHNGLDYSRITKSLIENIKNNKITQGASTITQQLARIAYLDNSKTYERKIKEALIAKKIEEDYSKDQILEMYINNCYFAHNLYGVSSAASYYFNKLPKDLNYQESALLVGIINAPNLYAPDIDYHSSINKLKQILYLLYENKVIDVETYYQELNRELHLSLKSETNSNILYYQDAINRQLEELNLNKKEYLRQGLKIKSSFDITIHNKINDIVKKHQKTAKNDEIAVVIMKPYSSDVLSLIGGFDFKVSPFNRAIESKRQIGSTIKPFIYYLGLNKGMTPLSKFTSEETTFNIEGIGEYSPKNASGHYANRKITMVEALGLSDNIYALKTTLLVGSKNVEALFNQFGFKLENVNPTIGLGSISLSPLELTSLYNCLASEGTYYKPNFIKQVHLQDGTLLINNHYKSKKILNSYQTILINYLLQAPFDNALTSYTLPSLINYQTDIKFGAKTGSTNSTNWVMGFNKYYTIGVYVGNDNNEVLSSKSLAKILFKEIANSLCENYLDTYYQVDSKMKPFTLYNSLNNKKSRVYYY
ncbi:MAG: penicillin-binding protein [Erysipelotrichaceae bacterium]|nr:penicillin-binding protein [Erysipelotrichaceae bacterium]